MATPPSTPFAVIGATGQQGGAVVDALLDRGAAVRAIVRDPSSAPSVALAARGVELSVADQDDPSTMQEPLRGVAGLFLMTTYDPESGGTEGEARRGRAMAEAAAAAGVPHVVYSSVGGADRESGVPHFESKRRVEERLLELLPTGIVRPAFFMENLARSLGGDRIDIRLPMPGDVPLQMVAVRDIGIVSAAALLDPSVLPGGALEIAGDELTGDGIADAAHDALGLPSSYQPLPLSVFADDPDRTAMFRWFVETPAYQADLAGTRRIDPGVLDLRAWFRSTGTGGAAS